MSPTVNLFMAAVWLVLGAILFGWQWAHPEQRALTILGSNVSLAWLPLAFGLWDLARWWLGRSRAQARAAAHGPEPPTRPAGDRPPAAPNPDFDFTDEPGGSAR